MDRPPVTLSYYACYEFKSFFCQNPFGQQKCSKIHTRGCKRVKYHCNLYRFYLLVRLRLHLIVWIWVSQKEITHLDIFLNKLCSSNVFYSCFHRANNKASFSNFQRCSRSKKSLQKLTPLRKLKRTSLPKITTFAFKTFQKLFNKYKTKWIWIDDREKRR